LFFGDDFVLLRALKRFQPGHNVILSFLRGVKGKPTLAQSLVDAFSTGCRVVFKAGLFCS
jgi:hypothetical protein